MPPATSMSSGKSTRRRADELSVYAHRREVASLEDLNSLTSRLSYHDDVEQDDFVSLTMPVQRKPWDWDDQLHPIFQMNLPEDYMLQMLQMLQEQFGPISVAAQ